MVTTTLDQRYSDPDATAVQWSQATDRLRSAGLSFVVTVRPDGRPHATPLITVWHDEGLYFCTGPQERKARNLAQNPRCALITGTDALHDGLDIVVEGRAVRVTGENRLTDLARAWEAKYGPDWHFDVADGAFHHRGGSAWVFQIVPDAAFSFGKEPYSQTRYRFGER